MQIAGTSAAAQQIQMQVQQAFTQADANGDNVLSEEEFASFDATMKANAPEGMDTENMPSASDMFAHLDVDGDGTVSEEELQNGAPPPPPLADETLNSVLQDMEEAFAAADADGDGVLSEAEFEAFDETMRANAPDGGPDADGSEIFSQMDTNGDGVVSEDELAAHAPPPPPPPAEDETLSEEDTSTDLTLLSQLYAQYEVSNDLFSSILDIAA